MGSVRIVPYREKKNEAKTGGPCIFWMGLLQTDGDRKGGASLVAETLKSVREEYGWGLS